VKLQVDIQTACAGPTPEEPDLRRWIEAALAGRCEVAEVSVRLVEEQEMAALNFQYRGKPGPTNVLSFPAELPPGVQCPLLGDIVICPDVVDREAREQHKTGAQHWMHMLVHGSLHLLGFDHVEEVDARRMEALESQILQDHGYPNPYVEAFTAEAGA
jgi:probable rRNA maturation factor